MIFLATKAFDLIKYILIIKDLIVAIVFIVAFYLAVKIIQMLIKKPPRVPSISYYLGDDIMDDYYDKVSSALVTLHQLPPLPVNEDASQNIQAPEETLQELTQDLELPLQGLLTQFDDKAALEKKIRDVFDDEPVKRIKTNQLFQTIQTITNTAAELIPKIEEEGILNYAGESRFYLQVLAPHSEYLRLRLTESYYQKLLEEEKPPMFANIQEVKAAIQSLTDQKLEDNLQTLYRQVDEILFNTNLETTEKDKCLNTIKAEILRRLYEQDHLQTPINQAMLLQCYYQEKEGRNHQWSIVLENLGKYYQAVYTLYLYNYLYLEPLLTLHQKRIKKTHKEWKEEWRDFFMENLESMKCRMEIWLFKEINPKVYIPASAKEMDKVIQAFHNKVSDPATFFSGKVLRRFQKFMNVTNKINKVMNFGM